MVAPVRIAQILGKMNGGGVESVVMNYYRHIDRSRVQFDFLVDDDSALVPYSEIESLGGRVIKIPPYQRQSIYQRKLIRLFREERWPIVHSHINTLSVFPLRAAGKAGVPVRVAHSHSTAGKGEYLKNAMKYALRTQANRYPTHRMACGRYAGEWLFGKEAEFEVIRNAIDVSDFESCGEVRERVRRELGVPDGAPLVGHMGRFTKQKNHMFLLEVFRAVLSVDPDAVLALAGSGPLFGRAVEAAGSLGISDSVRFLGNRSDTPALYQAFDVFCLPSLYEGLPVVSLECQAAGTPILASTEVTREAAATSLMEFEPLSSPPETWASHVLSMKGASLKPGDAERLREFDVGANTERLTRFYLDKAGR